MKSFLAAILLMSVSQVSFAADIVQIEEVWGDCLESEQGQSTVGMISCSFEAFESADAELNSLYKNLMKDEDAEVRGRLRAAQRAWITYRDTNCALAGVSMLGGTGENVLISGCRTQMTIDRVKELQQIFAVN